MPTRARYASKRLWAPNASRRSRARAALPDASPELAAELLTQKGEWRKKHKRAQSLAEDDADGGVRRALAALLALPPAAYTDAQWAVLAAMLEWQIRLGAMRARFTPQTWSDLYRNRPPHGELYGRTLGLIGFGFTIWAIVRAYRGKWMPYGRLIPFLKPLPQPAVAA